MLWQLQALNNDPTWDDGITFREDLPKHGNLSCLYLELSGNPETDSMNEKEEWRLHDWIDEIRIMAEGNHVLKKFNGRVAQRLAVADGWPSVVDQYFNYGSSKQRWHIPINFGRYPGDPHAGLPLDEFKNVQLQFTNTFTDTEYDTAWDLNLHALMLVDSVDPRPFTHRLETKEYETYITVADAYHPMDYPEEGLLRRILWQIDADVGAAENAERTVYGTIDEIHLTFKTGAYQHIKHSPRDLWMLEYLMGMSTHLVGGEPYHSNGQGIRTGLGQTILKAIAQMPQGGTPGAATIALEPGNDGSTQKMLRTGTDNYSQLWLGHGLENCVLLPFSRNDDPAEYLNLETYKTVKQRLHVDSNAAAADATVITVLDMFEPNY